MRLLYRKHGKLRFTWRKDEEYAILSHRWLAAEEEVSYDDVLNGRWDKPGFEKIDFCLIQAERDGYKHVWIDTCCINNNSDAELSRSLNSMFRWYAESAVCYVYLSDVTIAHRNDLTQSQWFTRGWTLQELIAPQDVHFYSTDCHLLGDKVSLHDEISTATRFGTMSASLSERFSWSLGRQTKEPEDMSYCMIGLMGVSLSPIYGIGAKEAQEKLFLEIERKHGRAILEQIMMMANSAGQAVGAHFTGHFKDDTQALLDSLEYSGMNSRWESIENPFPKTCRWLLDNFQYKQWLDNLSPENTKPRMLWIKGKPGSGKSTIMKFAETHAEGVPKISFYFNARGSRLERSVEGMYRSLLYQLMQLNSLASAAAIEACRLVRERTGRSALSLQSLRDVFAGAVKSLDEPLRCFVDALDECKNDEVQDMVHFFEDLSKEARVHVCFASRYYPAVMIDSPELHLNQQSGHERGLREFVRGRLRGKYPVLTEQVIGKANGVFLWAALVVKELNKAIAEGSIYKAQRVLDSMPEDLLELLNTIATHGEDQARFEVCMHWILYNEDQLSPTSFCAAFLAQLEDAEAICAPVHAILCQDREDDDRVAQWILIWSRGLGEVTHGMFVRPMHESVRDLFLKDKHGPRIQRADFDEDEDPYQFKIRGCVSFLQMMKRRGFIRGARGTWPYYSQRLLGDCLNLAESAAPLSARIRLIEQLVTPACARNVESSEVHGAPEEPSSDCSAALLSHDELLGCLMTNWKVCAKMLSTAARFGIQSSQDMQSEVLFTLPNALFWAGSAIINGVFEALFAAGMNFNDALQHLGAQGYPEMTLFHYAAIMPSPAMDILLPGITSPAVRMSNGWTPLHMLVAIERETPFYERIHHLRGAQPEALIGRCALKMQAKMRYTNLIHVLHNFDTLVQYGVQVDDADDTGRSALMLAASLGQVKLVGRLIRLGASIEVTDFKGTSALGLGCSAGQNACVEVLLRLGADVNSKNKRKQTALMLACSHDGCGTRLDGEVPPSGKTASLPAAWIQEAKCISYFPEYETLEWSPDTAHKRRLDCIDRVDRIVKLMLAHGAEINAQDEDGRTALMIACSKQYCGTTMIESLLNHQADISIRDHAGRSALDYARESEHQDAVSLLQGRAASCCAVAVPDCDTLDASEQNHAEVALSATMTRGRRRRGAREWVSRFLGLG